MIAKETYQNNQLIFSNLKEFYEPVKATGFSIKYVVNGTEVYTLNNEQHIVKNNQYLLSNIEKEGVVEIESKQLVKGICISIDRNLIKEVVDFVIQPDSNCVEEDVTNFFTTTNFLDSHYNDVDTKVGVLLKGLPFNETNGFSCQNNEARADFFYKLAEAIVQDQMPVFKQLHNIPSVKYSTKKDLYKRIQKSIEFIDGSFENDLNINNIATHSFMSEYHFYRLFKQVQGISPMQYIIKKRLEKAKQLIVIQQMPITEVALHTGFTDVYSFSKMFKKYFQMSPSSLLKK